jgi:putative PIN family toxin of toxin-antitoxin system
MKDNKMKGEEKVVLDAYFIKGIIGKETWSNVYSKILREKKYAIVMSMELWEKYIKAIAKNGFSPSINWNHVVQGEIQKLEGMQKLRWVNEKIKEMKESDIKVKIEDEDDIPFVKAAFASKAKYIITQDKHFLSKKEEFKKYQIEVLKPEEFLKNNS